MTTATDARVTVRYFAQLRETAGRAEESVAWREGTTGASLYADLVARHGFALGLGDLRLAVNDRFTPMNAALAPGDVVVFIPPVAGG